MAKPVLLQGGYGLGMRRDIARQDLPRGAVWNLQDWIPNRLGAPLEKRGGWTYASDALGSSTYVNGVIHVPFRTAGTQLVAIGQDGNLYTVVGSTPTSHGAVGGVAQLPVFYYDQLFIPNADGVTAPKIWDGTTLIAAPNSPPVGKYAAVFKNRLALADNATIYFHSPGQLTAGGGVAVWDLSQANYVTSSPITALASMRAALLVFHQFGVERLRGSIPAGTTNSDIVLEPLFVGMGCIDARSVVNWNDLIIWADAKGIYQTDGAVPLDLTVACSMKDLWQDTLVGYTSSWTVAAGVIRDLLIVSVMNGTTFVDCFVIDLTGRTFWRFRNFGFRMFASSVGIAEELWAAHGSVGRVTALDGIFTAGVASDGDGSAILPILESPFYKPLTGKTRWRYAYTGHDLRNGGSAPTLAVSVASTPTGSYVALDDYPATTDFVRKRMPLRFHSHGMALRYEQTAASTFTRLYEIEVDAWGEEQSR